MTTATPTASGLDEILPIGMVDLLSKLRELEGTAQAMGPTECESIKRRRRPIYQLSKAAFFNCKDPLCSRFALYKKDLRDRSSLPHGYHVYYVCYCKNAHGSSC